MGRPAENAGKGQPAGPSSASSDADTYRNGDYGFEFELPRSWKGYSVLMEKWEGYAQSEKGQAKVAEGPKILIRHPFWREQEPRQDIPLMVFTLEQWNDLQAGKFRTDAAPINPSELGRNARYMFALPPRYDYAFPQGYEEVERILVGNPLHAF
jgi:hypothetical protein